MASRTGLLKSIQEKIFALSGEYRLLEKNDRVLVALSGGPDSVFLLHFLILFRKRYNLTLFALHLNHGLRGKASAGDEKFCRKFCMQNSIPLLVTRKNVSSHATENGLSVEEAGRELRYAALMKEAKRRGCGKIATAHNIDDNTESIILNLVKGTGITGLQGISPVIREKGIIRPLLRVRKKDITEYLDASGIAYCTDESNNDEKYQRNKIRNSIVPLLKEINPRLAEAVFRLSETLRKSEEQANSDNGSRGVCFTKTESGWNISLAELKCFSKNQIADILKKFFFDNFKTRLTFNDINELHSLINKQKGKKVQLKGKISVIREAGHFLIHTDILSQRLNEKSLKTGSSVSFAGIRLKISKIPYEKVYISQDKNVEFIDGEAVSGEFVLRKWRSGDVFQPIGFQGSKKVSDFLNSAKLSSIEKNNQTVLCCEGRIIWVTGLRLDERVKITDATKVFMRLSIERK